MFQITIKGIKSFDRKAKKIHRYFKAEMRREVKEMEKDLYAMFEKNFRREGPPGRKWNPLSPATEDMRKARVGYYRRPHKTGILNWSGHLLGSLKGKGKHAIKRIQSGCIELWLGTRHPLALTHHKGAKMHRPPIRAGAGKRRRGKWGTLVKSVSYKNPSPETSRGHKRKKKGDTRALSLFLGGGKVALRKRVGPADITIPARPFYTKKQVDEIVVKHGQRIAKEVFKIWNK